MKIASGRSLAIGIIAVMTAFLSDARAQEVTRAVGYLSANLFKASVEVQSLSQQRARLTLAGQGDERLMIEAAVITVTTTPEGLKISADGQATATSSLGTAALTAEKLELTVSRDGSGILRADGIRVRK